MMKHHSELSGWCFVFLSTMLKIAWAPNYVLPLPPNHRFPMSKYEVLPQQLLHEGTVSTENFFAPNPAMGSLITRTHEETYWMRLNKLELSPQEIRRTGFPLTQALVDREVIIMQGTVQCTQYALQYGVSMNIAGGTHHAFTNRGEGFCLLNDIAIAANYLLDQRQASKILVVDLDVHQGNGTAQIFRNEPRVFTFSMHGANNYPLHKEYSDLDKLGKLSVTREGCKQRDRIVLDTAKRNKIPLVASMGGGYSKNFRDIIEAHANTYRLAQEIFF